MLHSARLFIYSLSNAPISRPALGAYLEGPSRSNPHPPLISKLLQLPLSVASSVRMKAQRHIQPMCSYYEFLHRVDVATSTKTLLQHISQPGPTQPVAKER